MKIRSGFSLAVAMVFCLGSSAGADAVKVGDFRLDAAAYPADTSFDPGFTETTRSVADAPVQITSTFTGGTQAAGDAGNNTPDAKDIALRTTPGLTRIRNISKFKPSQNGGASGPARVGMVQWKFDLTPLDRYLSTDGLALTALELRLNLAVSDDTADQTYDLYLSYTHPGEAITLADIDNSTPGNSGRGDRGAGAQNFINFWNPAHQPAAAEVGDVVNRTHRVLVINQTGGLNAEDSQTLSEDLLALYNAGVREVNLQLAGGGYWSNRNIDIRDGSGLYITTGDQEPREAPEPG